MNRLNSLIRGCASPCVSLNHSRTSVALILSDNCTYASTSSAVVYVIGTWLSCDTIYL